MSEQESSSIVVKRKGRRIVIIQNGHTYTVDFERLKKLEIRREGGSINIKVEESVQPTPAFHESIQPIFVRNGNGTRYEIYEDDRGYKVKVLSGERSRSYWLGRPENRESPVGVMLRTIYKNFESEFLQSELVSKLEGGLRHGQRLKACLYVLEHLGYIKFAGIVERKAKKFVILKRSSSVKFSDDALLSEKVLKIRRA